MSEVLSEIREQTNSNLRRHYQKQIGCGFH